MRVFALELMTAECGLPAYCSCHDFGLCQVAPVAALIAVVLPWVLHG